jgi:hypothetical protein
MQRTGNEVENFSWPARTLFGLIAFAGTAVYAASFGTFEQSERVLLIARSVGVSSGISWVAFGIVLLGATRCRPSVLAWADACLRAQVAGIAVLMTSVLLNLISLASGSFLLPTGGAFRTVHVGIILIADVLMATLFVRHARRLGMKPMVALVLWVFILNGFFILFLIASPVRF